MKKTFCFLFFLIYNLSFSQTEKLFYYIEKDSLLGVKNQAGKIIIPAKKLIMPSIYDGISKNEITQNILMFWIVKEGPKAYDRNGVFLFEPYIFDNGFDYFTEDFMRFKSGKKMGLVNQKETIVIPAKYDYISSINFGLAQYCNGCYWDTTKDEEHPPLVGGIWGFVDKNGKEIKTTSKRNHPKDIETKENTYIPYQFKYNKKEEIILDFFEKRKNQIIKINGLNCSDKMLFFEIVEKPSKFKPFYKIKTFELCNKFPNGADETYEDFKIFKVSADGKKFYVLYTDLIDYEKYSDYVERKILVDTWINGNIKQKP